MLKIIGAICFVSAFGLFTWGDISMGIISYDLYYNQHDNYYQGMFWCWLFINLFIIGLLCTNIAIADKWDKPND